MNLDWLIDYLQCKRSLRNSVICFTQKHSNELACNAICNAGFVCVFIAPLKLMDELFQWIFWGEKLIMPLIVCVLQNPNTSLLNHCHNPSHVYLFTDDGWFVFMHLHGIKWYFKTGPHCVIYFVAYQYWLAITSWFDIRCCCTMRLLDAFRFDWTSSASIHFKISWCEKYNSKYRTLNRTCSNRVCSFRWEHAASVPWMSNIQ